MINEQYLQAYQLKLTKSTFPVFFCEEEECVVYNSVTGNTHLIDGIGVEIFRSVSKKVSTRTELLQNMRNIFDFQSDFDVEGFLDSLIMEYQKLGLVEVTEKHS